jgi:16S rRNA G966 N2-methylase RsmD
MVKKLIKHFDDDISISLLSCPSLFETISSIADNVKIFEFDEKFSKYGNAFVHYDYNQGDDEEYLKNFQSSFDLIILDPPFLSEECLRKSLMIVNRLKKEKSLIVLNTGSIQVDLAKEHGLNQSNFKPQHKNNLANDFSTFSNFDIDDFLCGT